MNNVLFVSPFPNANYIMYHYDVLKMINLNFKVQFSLNLVQVKPLSNEYAKVFTEPFPPTNQ